MGLPEGYRGFRFRYFKWFVWDSGLLEAYHVGRDPYELRSLAPPRRPHESNPPRGPW